MVIGPRVTPACGGAYTYDWIENLFGLNMRSADTVLLEYQHPQVGDRFGYGTNNMSFKIVEPEHVLATQSADRNWVWAFVLEEQDGRTRLISRDRFRLPKLKDKIGMIPMEPGSLVMECKMSGTARVLSRVLVCFTRPFAYARRT